MHHVGHEREIARLQAVAVDHRTLPAEHGRDEQRNDGRVGAVGVLPRSEDVEVADADRLETIGGREGLAIILGGQLGGPVGRDGGRQIGLAFAAGRLVAVGAARSGVNQPPHACPTRGIQQGDRAGDARGIGIQRRFDAARHAGQGRLVEDAVDPFDRLGHGLRIDQIALDELDPIAEGVHVREVARAEVIQHADVISPPDQCLGDMRADESRPAGNQKCTHSFSSCFASGVRLAADGTSVIRLFSRRRYGDGQTKYRRAGDG